MRWRVIPFSQHEPDLDEFIQCGTIVEVYHAETDASLLCEDEHGTSVDITPSRAERPQPVEGAPAGFGSLRCGAASDKVHLDKASAQRTYLFKNPEDAATRNTNSLWVIEKSTGFFGGPSGGVARWNSRFRFRHLNSGMLLALKKSAKRPKSAASKDGGRDDAAAKVMLVANPDLTEEDFADTEFVLEQKASATKHLHVHRSAVFFVKGAESNTFLMSGGAFEGHEHNVGLCGGARRREEDCFRLRIVPKELRVDGETAQSMMIHLEHFADRVSKGEFIPPDEVKFMQGVLAQLIEWVIIPEPNQSPNPLEMDGLPHRQRQIVLKEQSCVQLLFEMISASHVRLEEEDLVTPHKRVVEGYVAVEHLASADFNMAQVFRLGYALINRVLVNNPENQMHAAKWMDVMIQHLGFELGAEDAMTVMLEDNRELLVTRVTEERVQNFIELVQRHGKTTQVVPKFLEACCDAKGDAIVENQNMLVGCLLGDPKIRKDLFIEVKLVEDDSSGTPWNPCCPMSMQAIEVLEGDDGGRFSPVDANDAMIGGGVADVHGTQHEKSGWIGSEVEGGSLGKIFITWTSPKGREGDSPGALFADQPELRDTDKDGRVWVPLEAVYHAARGVSKKFKAERKAERRREKQTRKTRSPVRASFSFGAGKDVALVTTKMKHAARASRKEARRRAGTLKAVGKYFRRQVLLLAQMCCERNYHGIKALEAEYPYLLCYTALRNDALPHNVRAAFVRLALHLHVNRSPQENLVVPALTRTWDDAAHGGAAAEIPSAARVNAFFLLQDVVLAHLRECASAHRVPRARAFHKFTREIALLLRQLVEYGQYGRTAFIEDLKRDLIPALEACIGGDEGVDAFASTRRGSAPQLSPQNKGQHGDDSDTDSDEESGDEDREPIGGFAKALARQTSMIAVAVQEGVADAANAALSGTDSLMNVLGVSGGGGGDGRRTPDGVRGGGGRIGGGRRASADGGDGGHRDGKRYQMTETQGIVCGAQVHLVHALIEIAHLGVDIKLSNFLQYLRPGGRPPPALLATSGRRVRGSGPSVKVAEVSDGLDGGGSQRPSSPGGSRRSKRRVRAHPGHRRAIRRAPFY